MNSFNNCQVGAFSVIQLCSDAVMQSVVLQLSYIVIRLSYDCHTLSYIVIRLSYIVMQLKYFGGGCYLFVSPSPHLFVYLFLFPRSFPTSLVSCLLSLVSCVLCLFSYLTPLFYFDYFRKSVSK
jgi:hypothetical protein